MKTLRQASLLACLLLVLTACSLQPVQDTTELYWWQVRYRLAPDANGQTRWALDLLLADRVIHPLLLAERENIPLWRFHRRAVDDSSGHQFSFIFYSSRRTAATIQLQLQADSLTRQLLQNNLLREVVFDTTAGKQDAAVAATSDDNWSPAMQKNWPVYIMGVSELWLGLIAEFSATVSSQSLPRLLAEYRRIDSEITALWQAESRHALYHHLHALFGYPAENTVD